MKTISAKNSNVWMCKNNRGLPGAEYYIAENDNSVVFFTKTVTEFDSDVAGPVTIASKRDYVDLIIDRDGINNHTFDGVSDIPDRGTNINVKNGDLNSIGSDNYRPGKLAPGVYTITDGEWDQENAPMDETYYRISYIGEAPYKVKIGGEEVDLSSGPVHRDGLVIVKSENNTYISTELKNDWPTSGDYSIETKIEIVYENAAIDVNGKLHDVVLTVDKVTFKDLDRIPTDGNRGPHDGNNYYDTDGSGYYYRPILQATKDQGVLFKNYVLISSPEYPWDEFKALSGGSGTDIDFNIRIDKANPDTSFVFYVDDLDVAAKQDWVYPKQNDPCFDNLPIENATYGKGGEGFMFTDGNLSDPKFAPHTGLAYVDGQVITTGSDPNTPWSEFTITTDAYNGGNYTWTSGIGCTTYVLKNTPKLNLGEIELELKGNKELLGRDPQDGEFEFELVPDTSVSDNLADAPITVSNVGDVITFINQKFDENNKVTIDDVDYYPGTKNDATNTHGEGKHLRATYAYKVTETEGDDEEIIYDDSEHKLKIVVVTPENDTQMQKGIKAEIYVDDVLVNEVWSKDGKSTLNNLITFTNKTYVELTVSKTVLGQDADKSKQFSFTLDSDYKYDDQCTTEDCDKCEGDGILHEEGEIKVERIGFAEPFSYVVLTVPEGVTVNSIETDAGNAAEAAGYTDGRYHFRKMDENQFGNQSGVATVGRWFINYTDQEGKTYTKMFNGVTSMDEWAALPGQTLVTVDEIECDKCHGNGYVTASSTFTLADAEDVTYKFVYGSAYDLSEDDYSQEGYLTKVDGTKNNTVSGKLTGDKEHEFTNILVPSISAPGEVTVTGDKPAKPGKFTFTVTGSEGAPMPEDSSGNKKTINVTGPSEFNIGDINFEEPGTYTYTIKQKNNGETGYTYDNSEYVITVTVNDDYTYTVTWTKDGEDYTDGVLKFENIYKKPAPPSGYVIPKTGV